MYVASLSLLFVGLIWVIHYELPKLINDESYSIRGVATGYTTNNTPILGKPIGFTGAIEYLNGSCFLQNNNETDHIRYWFQYCDYDIKKNNNFNKLLTDNTLLVIIVCWALNFIMACVGFYELTRDKLDFISSTKYKLFVLIWLSSWFIFTLLICIFEVVSLTSLQSKSKYTGYNPYQISGKMLNSSYTFKDQYELLTISCSVFTYKQQDRLAIRFDTCQNPTTISNYQQLDLLLMIISTCGFFASMITYLSLTLQCNGNEKNKEEYGEL